MAIVNNEKLLTISIAAYNIAGYLEEAIKSCLIEKLAAIEIIIVNDGSSDATPAIAERYQACYPDVVKVISQDNGGYGSTINASLAAARGRYFKVLDGDDWLDTKSLASLIEKIEKFNVDIIAAKTECVYERLNESRVKDELALDNEGVYQIADLSLGTVSMHSFLYRTQLLRDCALQLPRHCLYTDTILATVPIDNSETLFYYPHSLYRYRVGRDGQSMSFGTRRTHYRDAETVLFFLLEYPGSDFRDGSLYTKQCCALSVLHYKLLGASFGGVAVIREMSRYDKALRCFPKIYSLSGAQAAFVRILRKTRFTLAPLMHPLFYRMMSREQYD